MAVRGDGALETLHQLHENAIHPRLLCPAALLPGICRKGTLFRLDHLKKNYPDAHPCTKLCVLESHFKPSRLTDEVPSRHAFRDNVEALDEHLWSLQAQDDADSSLRPSASRTITRKTTTKRNPDAPLPGSRVANFVKERQRLKELVEQDAEVAQHHPCVAGVRS